MVRPLHLEKYAQEYIYKLNNRPADAKGVKFEIKTIVTPENLKRVLHYKDLIKHSLNSRCTKKAS